MAEVKKFSHVSRKVKRKQTLYLKYEPDSDVTFQEGPSCHVFVANGGLQNGLSRELLEYFLTESLMSVRGELKELYLPAGKDYAFATFDSVKAASATVTCLNGVCIQQKCRNGPEKLLELLSPKLLSGPPLHLYLCFVDKIPLTVIQSPVTELGSDLPPGLVLVEEFISTAEERDLLYFFSVRPSHSGDPSLNVQTSKTHTQETSSRGERGSMTATGETAAQAPESFLRHRYVKHFGYEFLYSSNNVDPDSPIPGGIPPICQPLLRRMVDRRLVEDEPDQLTINQYLPGAGIPPHVDTHSAFIGGIISLSLGSHVVMDFRHPDGRKISVFLPRRSLLLMAGEARYLWTHGIAARQFDEVHSKMPGYPSAALLSSTEQSRVTTATTVPRGTRLSLTFRKVRRKPCLCDCDYPLFCDSNQHVEKGKDKLAE